MEAGDCTKPYNDNKIRREPPFGYLTPVAKRWCPITFELSVSEKSNETKLCTIDCYSLQHIMTFLETRDIIVLLFAGNTFFNGRIKSQLQSYSYIEHMPLYNTDIYISEIPEASPYRIQWPCLLSDPLPMLHTVNIHALEAEWHDVNLSVLPKTLTRLSLKHSTLLVKDNQHDRVVDLPKLLRLSIVNLKMTGTRQDTVSFASWVPQLLCKSLQLSRFTYHSNYSHDSCNKKVARSLPESLQTLHANTLLLVEADFLRLSQLHTLKWQSYDFLGQHKKLNLASGFTLPKSLTSLHLENFGLDETLYQLISLAPSSLLHLSTDARINCTQRFSEYARFTGLQSLITSSSIKSLNEQDYALLPRSLTTLSNLFAAVPEQWQHLTKTWRFVEPKHKSIDEFLGRDECWADPSYTPENAASENCTYFPVNLFGVQLWNVAPLIPLVGLKRATCRISQIPLEGIPYSTFDQIISAVAHPTLTALNIVIDSSAGKFFQLTNYKHILSNLLQLSVLWVCAPYDRLSIDELYEWFESVPKSVSHLQLNLTGFDVMRQYKRDILSWRDGLLGPNLVSLFLATHSLIVEFPRTIPPGLTDYTVLCHAFSPPLHDCHLASLPPTTTSLTLSATTESKSICFSREAIKAFEQPFSARKKREINILNGLFQE